MRLIIYDAERRHHFTTGYGKMSQHFGKGLSNKGHEIFYHTEKIFPEKIDMWLWIRPPHFVGNEAFNKNNINIFYTMHEQNELHGKKQEWPALLNKCDAVITPTEWGRKVWIDNGVTVPVYTVPLGVDTRLFKGAKSYKFSILSMFEGLGSEHSRDFWKDDIQAYFELFYDEHHNDVSYTFKSWKVRREDYKNFIRQLIQQNGYDENKLPTIQIIEKELPNTEMNNLYLEHWVFLKNSHGEGWGCPGLEALSADLRVVANPLPGVIYLNKINCDFFTNYTELKQAIWKNWKQYKEKKDYINSYSWEKAIIKLSNVLEEIYAKAKA